MRALIISAVLLLLAGPAPSATAPDVRVIPISGEVSPSMAAFVERAVRETQGASLIIFEMDTFGGRVDSALRIVDAITHMQAPSAAWVKTKAISAGALIALSTDTLFMKSGTTFGDCAPITYGEDGPKMLGEKFQSPLRAKFRALARKNGYSEVLAEAMVSADLEILSYAKEGQTIYVDAHDHQQMDPKPLPVKTVVKKGELLTMDDVEAKSFGFSKESLASAELVAKHLGFLDAPLTRHSPSWSEKLAGWILTISPFLIIIGLGSLYTEFKMPGFGIFGFVGLLALGLALFGGHLTGLATYAEILLIAAGFLLILAEIFIIPGFGAAGIAGFVLLVSGLLLSLQGFSLPAPDLPWQMEAFKTNLATLALSFGASILFAMALARWLLPVVGKKVGGPYLDATLKASHADSKETARIQEGATGVALTTLRPSGKGEFSGQVFDVVTQGDLIDKGEPIFVCQISGNRIVVRRREP